MKLPLPPAVRILPMGTTAKQDEFVGWSIERTQQEFFLGQQSGTDWNLVASGGRYRYQKRGMRAVAGTVVLFQAIGHIIASAELLRIQKRLIPPDDMGGVYRGAYFFRPESIRVFTPIGQAEVQGVWQKVTHLENPKWNLEPKNYPEFLKLVKEIETDERSR